MYTMSAWQEQLQRKSQIRILSLYKFPVLLASAPSSFKLLPLPLTPTTIFVVEGMGGDVFPAP